MPSKKWALMSINIVPRGSRSRVKNAGGADRPPGLEDVTIDEEAEENKSPERRLDTGRNFWPDQDIGEKFQQVPGGEKLSINIKMCVKAHHGSGYNQKAAGPSTRSHHKGVWVKRKQRRRLRSSRKEGGPTSWAKGKRLD